MKMKVSCVIFVYFLSFATYSFGKGILDEIGDAIDDDFVFGKCFPNAQKVLSLWLD